MFNIGLKARMKIEQWRRDHSLPPQDFDAYFLQQKRKGFAVLLDRAEYKLGYRPNLKSPKTLNEKMMHRRIFSRDPIFQETSDKIDVRDWVRARVPESDLSFFPMLGVIDEGEDFDPAKFPPSFALKAAWASGLNIFSHDGSVSVEEINAKMRQWRAEPYRIRDFIWAAQHMKRRFIVEELVVDENGDPPKDFRFFMFGGEFGFLVVDQMRDEQKESRAIYGPDLQPLKIHNVRPIPKSYDQLPAEIGHMIDVAKQLSKEFDMIRVDLYSHDGEVYFAELTSSHASGMAPFNPRSFDEEMGARWAYDAKAVAAQCDAYHAEK